MAVRLFFRIAITMMVTVGAIMIDTFAVRMLDIDIVDPTVMSSLGWGDPGATIVYWTHLGIVGVAVITITWMVTAPLQDDVRQEVIRFQ